MNHKLEIIMKATQHENNELKKRVAELTNHIHEMNLTQFGMLQEIYQNRLSTFAKIKFQNVPNALNSSGDVVLLKRGRGNT